ncbi:DUF4317 domain-containing protein [Clostridium kluyveri]|uniref:DUF4317 domain-containing protein n=1 Tax=Clostridium kluyveri TaxID=1534 RepID=A0A1L5FC31_CLOKL|nr:DUF4317 domain-containing protein [Clostridium kluyveri]APM40502.1 hypothetical protein BS101_18095 [Clostridium kluyveri]APM40565.1 hypothetical protein BS101_18475 [Clostridium kluyveri]
MNKKDLSDIRKEFKLGSYMLKVKEIYSVYLKKDNGEIITGELEYFEMMEVEKRELYLNNFKKVLTGTLDSKIFELDFKNINEEESEENTQHVLYAALNSKERISEYADKIVDKISQNYNYDTDVVISFTKAEYYSDGKRKKDSLEEYVQAIEVILCSVNKVEIPKKMLKFDYTEMKFKPNSALDMVINLNSPVEGFMFPSFTSEYVDVNKIIYYSSKSKKMNNVFVEKVLECNIKPTALEEKENFNAILGISLGGKIKPDIVQDIYERINEKFQDEGEEEPILDINEVTRVLRESGVENTGIVKSAFEEVCGGDYEFKVRNVIPDFGSKSIKIENESTNITISPRDLSTVKQVVYVKSGKKCLLIELKEDMVIDGFNLETEVD